MQGFVFQGRPGHMIPYMGLQAFDFCASALFTFTMFSCLPYLKSWILSLVSSAHRLLYCYEWIVLLCCNLL